MTDYVWSLENLFGKNDELAAATEPVIGYDFNKGVDYEKLLQSYRTSGFQALNLGKAVEQVNEMIAKKMEPLSEKDWKKVELNPIKRKRSNCTIFLGYTSNMISSGVREIIKFLAQHNMVDCIVVTAGGVEEDFMKCLGPTFLGDFRLDGKKLRQKRINRIGNLLISDENYYMFEEWLGKILVQLHKEQDETGSILTPSKLIWRMGKEINNPDSVYYWCYKNRIPVFSPAVTDGAIGDVFYHHSCKQSGLLLDIAEDIRLMTMQALYAAHSGMLILGGGLIKHHICNANLFREGADYSVFINTGQEYDGSDAGAAPDEAVSWGKINFSCRPVKVFAEATLVFPLLVAETFAKHHHSNNKRKIEIEPTSDVETKLNKTDS